MKKLVCLAVLMHLLFLLGCGFSGSKNLRTDYDNKFSMNVSENYQKVYRDYVRKIEKTHRSNLYDKRTIRKDIYTDVKTAYINSYLENLLGQRYMEFLIDIKYLEENKTNVTAYWYYLSWDHKGEDKANIKYIIEEYKNSDEN